MHKYHGYIIKYFTKKKSPTQVMLRMRVYAQIYGVYTLIVFHVIR